MRRRTKSGMTSFGMDIIPDFTSYRRVMLRRLGRLPKVIQMVVVLTLGMSVLLYGWLLHSIISNPFKSDSFTERDKCPACFGTHMCVDFREGKTSFTGGSRLRFLHFLNVKNVFTGYYGDDEVVFKRLAHNAELQAFDDRICVKAGHPMDCDVSSAIGKGATSGTKWMLQKVKGQSDMMSCPSERLLETIMHYYEEKVDAVDLSLEEKLQLVTTLLVNPEPLVLQTFSQKQGYPFPKYHGACGRLVVEEYVGHSLDHYYNSPWATRVKLAYQLMKIAEKFTENTSQFGIYWTDLTYENLAVDRQGQIKVIDAENIIVVDKWQIKKDKKSGWDEPYYAEFDECTNKLGGCISVFTDLLCERHTSDFNYYVVCRSILSSYADEGERRGGLLHDVPKDVEDRYRLTGLLNECAKPSEAGDRLRVKDELLEIFKSLSRMYS